MLIDHSQLAGQFELRSSCSDGWCE